MELRQIRYAVSLAHTGSFSKAAERVSGSVRAVMNGVAKLEAALETQLFHRNGADVVLTEAGDLFVRRGQRILDACDRLIQSTNRNQKVRQVPTSEIVDSRTSKCISPLILSGPPRVIVTPKLVLVVGMRHRFAQFASVSVRDLEEEALVVVPGCGSFAETNRLLVLRGFKPRVIYETCDLARALDLLKENVGAAILPPIAGVSGIVQVPFEEKEFSEVHSLQ